MFLKKNKIKGRIYLSYVQGYRENGTVKHKTIKSLGYVDELEKTIPDPIGYYKEQLKTLKNKHAGKQLIKLNTESRLESNSDLRKNLGYAVPKSLYTALDIPGFFYTRQRRLKAQEDISYNLNHIFSILVFNRFLFPENGPGNQDNDKAFFEPEDFTPLDIYQALDYISDCSEDLQRHLQIKIANLFKSVKRGRKHLSSYFFTRPDYIGENSYDVPAFLPLSSTQPYLSGRESLVELDLYLDEIGLPHHFDIYFDVERPKNTETETKIQKLYLREPRHIKAYFLIVYTAMLLMRLIEYKLDYRYSSGEIRQSLSRYSCSLLEENYYMFDYRDNILIALEKTFGFDFSRKYLTLSKIRKITSHVLGDFVD